MSCFNIGVRKILKWQIFCITVNNILYKLYAYVLLVTTTMRLTMEHGMSVIIQLPVLNAVLIPSQYMQSWPCQSVHVQASFSQRQDYLFALIQTYPLALLWHTRGKVSGQSPVVPFLWHVDFSLVRYKENKDVDPNVFFSQLTFVSQSYDKFIQIFPSLK